jgi:hypothetical protein
MAVLGWRQEGLDHGLVGRVRTASAYDDAPITDHPITDHR